MLNRQLSTDEKIMTASVMTSPVAVPKSRNDVPCVAASYPGTSSAPTSTSCWPYW